jgi:hypothetical protein
LAQANHQNIKISREIDFGVAGFGDWTPIIIWPGIEQARKRFVRFDWAPWIRRNSHLISLGSKRAGLA